MATNFLKYCTGVSVLALSTLPVYGMQDGARELFKSGANMASSFANSTVDCAVDCVSESDTAKKFVIGAAVVGTLGTCYFGWKLHKSNVEKAELRGQLKGQKEAMQHTLQPLVQAVSDLKNKGNTGSDS